MIEPHCTGSTTRLYAWGSNGAGQLGVGHQEDLSEPQVCLFESSTPECLHSPPISDIEYVEHVPNGATIRELVAGGNHTLVLTNHGVVYATGENGDARCGASAELRSMRTFRMMSWARDRGITNIAATWEASFLVENGRKVWALGSGEKGELGLGQGMRKSITPQLVLDVHQLYDSSCRIVSISGSMSHIVVTLSNGQAYGWGSCRKGQLGRDLQNKKSMWQPHRIDLGFPVLASVVGRDFSLLMGSDKHSTILGDFKRGSNAPEWDTGPLPAHYLAGWSTIYRWSPEMISSYGLSRRGQSAPANLPPVSVLAAGSEHCLAILRDGRLVAWGWGEHGNCGTPVDDRGNVIDRFNEISTSSMLKVRFLGVGAGCATSFAWGTAIP